MVLEPRAARGRLAETLALQRVGDVVVGAPDSVVAEELGVGVQTGS